MSETEQPRVTPLTEIEKAELLSAASEGMLTPHGVERLRRLMMEVDLLRAELKSMSNNWAAEARTTDRLRQRLAVLGRTCQELSSLNELEQ